MSLKAVLHAHTDYSRDSNVRPADLVAAAQRDGIDVLAVTDHDEIDGALEARDCGGGIRIIVGEEVSSADGHVIGLFLRERIPPGLSAIETAKRIRGQGGVVLLPHAFLVWGHCGVGQAVAEQLVPWTDAIEVCNSQNPLAWMDAQAARFAERHNLRQYVGADVHLPRPLNTCYQVMPDFDNPQSFLAALRQAQLVPGRFGLDYVAIMVFITLWRKITGRPMPGFGANCAERRERFAVGAPAYLPER